MPHHLTLSIFFVTFALMVLGTYRLNLMCTYSFLMEHEMLVVVFVLVSPYLGHIIW